MDQVTPFIEFLNRQMPVALEMPRQMVGINSFTGNRSGVNQLGQLTASSFPELGFSPEFVPSTNPAWGDHLILTHPGRSNRSIAMISHPDTVFPPEKEIRNKFRAFTPEAYAKGKNLCSHWPGPAKFAV